MSEQWEAVEAAAASVRETHAAWLAACKATWDATAAERRAREACESAKWDYDNAMRVFAPLIAGG